MPFRLMGLPEEVRLAIEQASGQDTEQAKIVYEAAVKDAVETVNQSLREVQEIIGPHGAISRLQSGGIRIANGEGIGVYLDGVFKTNVQPNGTLVIGSDITDPSTTTEIFFVEETAYNGETFGAGDFLIGDNSTGSSNLKFDASEGQLQFRYGTTVNVYMDTDGSLKAGGGVVTLDNTGIEVAATTTTSESRSYKFTDSGGVVFGGLFADAVDSPNSRDLLLYTYGATGTSLIQIQASLDDGVSTIIPEIQLYAAASGNKIELNSKQHDVDVNIYGDDGLLVHVDAITNLVDISGGINIAAGETYDIDGSPHTHSAINGTFTTVDGKTVTVTNGVITGIV